MQSTNSNTESSLVRRVPSLRARYFRKAAQALQDHITEEFPAAASSFLPMHQSLVRIKRLFEQQLEFIRLERPADLDIGFHYTTPENLDSIRSEGLLTKPERAEREARGIESHFNGSSRGDGVYTSHTPTGYHYGTICLTVLRLQGTSSREIFTSTTPDDVTTASYGPACVVLRSSSQCAAFFAHDCSRMDSKQGDSCVVHRAVTALVDGLRTLVQSLNASNHSDTSRLFQTPHQMLRESLHKVLPLGALENRSRYTALLFEEGLRRIHARLTGNSPPASFMKDLNPQGVLALCELQATFRERGKPGRIDLGYRCHEPLEKDYDFGAGILTGRYPADVLPSSSTTWNSSVLPPVDVIKPSPTP
jgi:hypothetical protein